VTIMTLKETAEFLRVSAFTVAQLCRQNKIPHIKIGKRYIFVKETLEDWLKNEMKGEVSNG